MPPAARGGAAAPLEIFRKAPHPREICTHPVPRRPLTSPSSPWAAAAAATERRSPTGSTSSEAGRPPSTLVCEGRGAGGPAQPVVGSQPTSCQLPGAGRCAARPLHSNHSPNPQPIPYRSLSFVLLSPARRRRGADASPPVCRRYSRAAIAARPGPSSPFYLYCSLV